MRCNVKDFDPNEVKAGSVQLNARELRYNWFNELSISNENALIITAHQADDLIETFFINLTRGAGLKGLSGIPEVRDRIRRPLLPFNRAEIETFAQENRIGFREDSSNLSTKYLRNHIRHKVIPAFKEIEPNFGRQISRSIGYIADAAESWMELSDENFGIVEAALKQRVELDAANLKKSDQWMLSGQLLELGFNQDQISNIFDCIGKSGQTFRSDTTEVVIDRGKIVFRPVGIQDYKKWEVEVDKRETFKVLPVGELTLRVISRQEFDLSIREGADDLFMDFDKLPDKLLFRNWKRGDVFQPFGMTGRKKISDYFIDRKVSVDKKAQSVIVEGEGIVLGICGYEIANSIRVDQTSKSIMMIQFKPSNMEA